MKVRVLVVLAGVIVGIVAGVGPAGAVGPFGPQYSLGLGPPSGAAASIGPDGVSRGFVSASVGGAGEGALSYFEARSGSAPVRVSSPYTGRVLATAWDGVNSLYVVFAEQGSLNIAKRVTNPASFSAVTQLATGGVVSLFGSSFQADVVASAGKWWAVWSRPVGGPTGTRQLFQRRTWAGVQGATQITHTAGNVGDSNPSLASSGGQVTLIWTRTTNPQSNGPSILRLASSTGGTWVAGDLSTVGTHNDYADSIDYNGVIYAVWQRDGRIVEAERPGGTFIPHLLAGPGYDPRIGVSGGNVFVGSATGLAGESHILFAERTAGIWTTTFLDDGIPGGVASVLGQGGRARVVGFDGDGGAWFQEQTHP